MGPRAVEPANMQQEKNNCFVYGKRCLRKEKKQFENEAVSQTQRKINMSEIQYMCSLQCGEEPHVQSDVSVAGVGLENGRERQQGEAEDVGAAAKAKGQGDHVHERVQLERRKQYF